MEPTAIRDALNKPYYLFRPGQIVRRLRRRFSASSQSAAYEEVSLPWGTPIRVRPSDAIGSAIVRAGLYDLCVSEVLWRLLDTGETAIDAGANIGQMTSLMATRVGPTGKVLCFEPHPVIFRELSENVSTWQRVPGTGVILAYDTGLSDTAGEGRLRTDEEFDSNRGTASLERHVEAGKDQEQCHIVRIGRLDEFVTPDVHVGVTKIDVEGHELSLLGGAAGLLATRRLRDVVFEESGAYPSPVSQRLAEYGYTIFSIAQGPLGLRVQPAADAESAYRYEARSLLATIDAPRAVKRLAGLGYRCLRRPKPAS